MGGAAQSKTAKKTTYFTKNLSAPMLFEINASNFQEMFPDIFRNIEMINLEYF